MVIYLPSQSLEDTPILDELTPAEIVRELDKYVIGQADAKRAVAIALRNRIRRQKLDPDMAEDVMPKSGCWTCLCLHSRSPRTRRTVRARNCARNYARVSWTIGWSRLTSRNAGQPSRWRPTSGSMRWM